MLRKLRHKQKNDFLIKKRRSNDLIYFLVLVFLNWYVCNIRIVNCASLFLTRKIYIDKQKG